MCTSIAFTKPALFGRNLDLEYSFGEQVVITPRNHPFRFHHLPEMKRHLALIGMATVAEDTALYAEAVNEKGLYMAGLNFPGNAHYFVRDVPGKEMVAPYELIPLVLGQCETLAQARELLARLALTAIPFAPGYPLAPLHWHIADATGALVAEPMADGLKLYEDPVGVMTNNPPFPFQRMNLNNYQHLSPCPPDNRFAPGLELQTYGQGMGALGLPGDASPMSRFVRTAFLKGNAVFTGEPVSDVTQFFHILEAVAMVRGSVITPEGKCDMTTYACCVDAVRGVYYYKTYENCQLSAVYLFGEDLESEDLKCFPLAKEPQVFAHNAPPKG